ncbi:hypothetical protein BJ741DRAFT_587247 [Chytriomyces cf. hyalinus JEL632]|nr:hypothetical protein BJ741DRAFT_587247 [Chytriomyces cf. hyalinus JEL632]
MGVLTSAMSSMHLTVFELPKSAESSIQSPAEFLICDTWFCVPTDPTKLALIIRLGYTAHFHASSQNRSSQIDGYNFQIDGQNLLVVPINLGRSDLPLEKDGKRPHPRERTAVYHGSMYAPLPPFSALFSLFLAFCTKVMFCTRNLPQKQAKAGR